MDYIMTTPPCLVLSKSHPMNTTEHHYPTIIIDKENASLLRQGQVHLEQKNLPKITDIPKGALVRLAGEHGDFFGIFSYSPHHPTATRLISRDDQLIDAQFFISRLNKALSLRTHLFDEPYYRLCNSDSDGLAGLIIERHNDTFCIQCETAGMDRLLPHIVEALETLFNPNRLILKNDCDNRVLEGMVTENKIIKGDSQAPLITQENGLIYKLDALASKRTGWAFDQRDNRAFVSTLCEDKTVVDFFTYAGGFTLPCVAAGAKHVVAVDKSTPSLAWALQSAKANGLDDQIQFRPTDCIKEMNAMIERGERYDVVLCHPPAEGHATRSILLKNYRKLTRLSSQIANENGTFMISCASPFISLSEFMEQVSLGLNDAGRTGLIWHTGTAGADHPIHPSLPETAFLKCLILQLD